MAGSVNKVILIGRLGSDPDMRYTQNGTAVTNFNVATNEYYTDGSGKKQKTTEWHHISVFGKLAEFCGQHLAKGRRVYLEGKLRTRKWTDKNGNERQTTEVVAHTVQILDSAKQANPAVPAAQTAQTQSQPEEDDIPF